MYCTLLILKVRISNNKLYNGMQGRIGARARGGGGVGGLLSKNTFFFSHATVRRQPPPPPPCSSCYSLTTPLSEILYPPLGGGGGGGSLVSRPNASQLRMKHYRYACIYGVGSGHETTLGGAGGGGVNHLQRRGGAHLLPARGYGGALRLAAVSSPGPSGSGADFQVTKHNSV